MKLSDYYHGFELDIDSIGTYSIDKRNIALGYDAPLPYDFDFAEHIRLTFNVQGAKGAKIMLIGDTPSGYPIKSTVSATDDEIKTVLRRFFYDEKGKTRFDNGLSPYWWGAWTAHFQEWCRTRHDYDISAFIRRMEPSERGKLLAQIPIMGIPEQCQEFVQTFLRLLREEYSAEDVVEMMERFVQVR